MTTWYVGPGGNDNNSGRTWGTRLATLNGAEDQPVAAGDTVWVAPGVYRETLTLDVSGAAGRHITYIGDVTGEHTDGVGGPVRITGSDNDQTATRANCITTGATRSYRTFRAFRFDTVSGDAVNLARSETNIIIEDCFFDSMPGINGEQIYVNGNSQANITVRRCIFMPTRSRHIWYNATGALDAGHVIENCIFLGSASQDNVTSDFVGGITVRNSLFMGAFDDAFEIDNAGVGNPSTINNCIFQGNATALDASAVGEIVENYNTFWANATDRTNVNAGANSVAYPPLLEGPLLNAGYGLRSGFRLPWWFGSLSKWSQVRQRTGSNEPDEDFFGTRRPYTHGGAAGAQCSWGPVQWFDARRSGIRAYDGSLSMRQSEKSAAWMFVPGVTNTQHTITVRQFRTAGYGGHRKPTMHIKQPGQADRMTEAGGAAGAWVQLSDTFTPAADPPWLIVEMRNNCDFTTTTTVSTTSTSTLSTTSTTTQTVSTLTTTTTTLACDVWWDDLQVA